MTLIDMKEMTYIDFKELHRKGVVFFNSIVLVLSMEIIIEHDTLTIKSS